MEKVLKYFTKEKLNIHFPPDEIEKWKQLKNKYVTLGYRWVDFSMDYSMSKIRRYDRKNQREYNKRKNHESKMRNTFRGPGNIPIVYPPPSPSNMERYLMLERWSKNDVYNISNIAVYLYEHHGLKPCHSYQPDEIFATYNNYSNRHFQTASEDYRPVNERLNSYENTVRRSNTYHASHPPSLPPPPIRRHKSLPPCAPAHLRPSASPCAPPSAPVAWDPDGHLPSAPPRYTDLLDQLA